jgi:RNA polymerase sigma factor (sigma-70 family)
VVIRSEEGSFAAFVDDAGNRLRLALLAAYGPDAGADATAEALAYGWEHWDRVGKMENPAGYLYRVGQSKARRRRLRRRPHLPRPEVHNGSHHFEPGLFDAIAQLSDKQRSAVVLVHGYDWSITEVAEMLGISFSTAKVHLERGLKKLRDQLGVMT